MWRSSAFRIFIALLGAAGLVAPAWGAGASVAPGDAPSVRLDWEAPPECIDGGALDRAVSGQLGRPAFAAGFDAELVARGRIELGTGDRHRAEVVLATRGGEPLGVRTLASDTRDCHSLDDALAVMLAIMLNVSRADVPALAREAPPPARWRARAGAGAGVVFGLLPQAGLETVAAAGLMRGGWVEPGVDLSWSWTPESTAAEGRLQVQAVSARLAIAPVLAAWRRADLRLRVAAGAGPMWATAAGFARVYTPTRLFVEGRAGLQFGVRLTGPLWLQVVAEVGALPVRPTFAVSNGNGTSETLFEPQPVIAAAGLGLAFRAR